MTPLIDVARAAGSPLSDPRGLSTSSPSRDAVEQLERALESMLSYFGDPIALLEQVTAQAPSWAYPRVLLASLFMTFAERGMAGQAADALAGAQGLLAGATVRERAHAAAAQAAVEGDWEAACRLWEGILIEHPRDVAALLFAHLFDFYRGDALNLRRRPQRVLPAWRPDMPLYSYVLGMQAFGLEESGQYPEAEDLGRQALAINQRDPWSVHAVTHVMEMQGRHAEGARWLAGRQADWAVDNGFSYHNWFHAALFEMENLDTAAALAIFDAHLATSTDMALQRVDGTAVLWRLKLLGIDVTERFQKLHAAWQAVPDADGFYAFNDVHAALAALGAGAPMPAVRDAAQATPTERHMANRVGHPLLRALAHYGAGQHADAARELMRVRDHAHEFGGSHAQRDLLTWLVLDAATQAGEHALARHVLNERYPAKQDTPLTAHWLQRLP